MSGPTATSYAIPDLHRRLRADDLLATSVAVVNDHLEQLGVATGYSVRGDASFPANGADPP
ncbi:hypothetical protein [Halobellus salinus]|uniref:hypothetical protein n=1 Tax=Halobellus salinus TaxID=931585 RepID=UPI00166A46B9|nr:hypothetical protein [Halobellus salinus]SMP18942.1 hypothetical protein SAMN06265347_1071 [Halobellus salinus]